MQISAAESASGWLSAGAGTSPPSSPTTSADKGISFAESLRGLGGQIDGGEATVRQALDSMQSGDMEPGRLLALQAGVYRYGEVIDLTSDLVDRATGGVKTVVQGGGQ